VRPPQQCSLRGKIGEVPKKGVYIGPPTCGKEIPNPFGKKKTHLEGGKKKNLKWAPKFKGKGIIVPLQRRGDNPPHVKGGKGPKNKTGRFVHKGVNRGKKVVSEVNVEWENPRNPCVG